MTGAPEAAGSAELAEFTVGAVARRLGIPVATLRSWNRRYGIGPTRLPGRHRHYTAADLAALSRMVELIRAGASPASAAKAGRLVLEPTPELGAVDPVVAAAEAMDVARLLHLLDAHLAHHGVIATWNRLCRPAFARIVDHQHRGDGYIDVEHLLSWALTTSLHRCVPAVAAPGGQVDIVLACTPGEQHVLPLEVLRAALAENRRPALLLGANVPTSALAQALSRYPEPPTVLLWSQSARTASVASVHASELGRCEVLLAGPGWAMSAAVPERYVLRTLEEAVEVLCGETS
ncbi:MerR family transcriptional regulator [Nocardia sp. NPDC056100]|uniref:MerR family transcriptional regulator n=1 Tax=Nocardia sp. NPDC056100 TaxID=3345712 RepID=UPI0035E367C9